jgi:hypothetical protein
MTKFNQCPIGSQTYALAMKNAIRIVIAALFLQTLVGVQTSNAATAPLRILSAALQGEQVVVAWTPQKLARKDFYVVEFTKVSPTKSAKVIQTKGSKIVAKLDPFSKYTVRVRQALKPKKWTAPRSFTTTTLSTVELTTLNVTTTGAELAWNTINGATSYHVYANGKLLTITTELSHIVTGLLPGSINTYSVSAVGNSIEGPKSAGLNVTTLIDTPVAPTLSGITSNLVNASWEIDKNAVGYEVVLYDSLGTTMLLTNKVEGSIGKTTFSGLTLQTSYAIGIKNVYANSASKQSPLATFTTLKPALTGVITSNVTTTSATLNWVPLPGVSNYEVYRDNAPVAAATAGLTLNSVSYTWTGLLPGNTYKFSVRASYLDGTKTLAFTDLVDVTQTLLTDPSFAPVSVVGSGPAIVLPYATVPIVGATISASNGLWTGTPAVSTYAYQWQRSLDGGTTWTNLTGQVGSTYKVTASDYPFRLRVRVTATNLNGSTVANSATSGAVAESFNIQIPIVRGNLVVGQLLEVTDGVWTTEYPLTFRYQWVRGTSTISGATSPSYRLTDADVDQDISVSVIAFSTLGSVPATSTRRSAVGAAGNTVAPAVTGTVKIYNTLTSSAGTWLNTPTLTYQWQRSSDGIFWNNIASATNSTYVIAVGDAGYFIRSQVFGSKTISGTTYVYTSSSASTVVVPAPIAISTAAPVVSGSWTTGSTLSTTNGSWTSGGTFTYQWQRSTDNSTWTSITGATASTYVLTADDASKFVRVQVYLNGGSGSDGIAYSVPTAKVGAPYNTVAPALSGTLRVGVAQTVSNGTWSGSPTFTYQWQTSADGIAWANISGATSATYTPTYTIANLRLRSVVSATNAVDTATATSQVVQGFLAPIATAIPAITGTVEADEVLTTDAGTWPSTSSGYLYGWQRSSDNGATWTDIGGATATTYTLLAGDVGYRIRSQVTVATNTGSSTAYSLPTVAVAP